ncbi:RHS repeat domain-containing protein, partial [Effusibacillus consociatus]
VMTQSLLNDVFAAKGGNGNGNGGGSSAAPPSGGNGNGGNSGNNGNGNGNGNQGHGNDGNNGKGNNDDKGNNGKSDEKHGKGHAYGKYKNRFKGSEQEFKERFYVQNFTNDVATPLPTVLMTTNEDDEVTGIMAYGMGLIGKSYIPANDPNNGWEDNPNNSEVNSGSESIPGKGKANGHNKGTLAGTESNSAETESLDPSEFYYLQDRMGSVVGLTDPTGKMITKYHYDEFGVPHSGKKFDKNWPGPNNTFGYTGLEYDYTTGLNYARARYYMPEVGRFISQDPWLGSIDLPISQNRYPYVLNNPLKWLDPSGKSPNSIEKSSNLQEILKTPNNRINWVNDFFERHKGKVLNVWLNYGIDIVEFMKWERRSRRLGDPDTGQGGSWYWKLANGAMINDMMLAETLMANRQEDQAPPTVKLWIEFIKDPSQSNLWAAHNASIFHISKILMENGLTFSETPAEQAFIDSVLIRVGLTPIIGTPLAPTYAGAIGFFINHEPTEYPDHYPAAWDDRAVYPFWTYDEEWREIYER